MAEGHSGAVRWSKSVRKFFRLREGQGIDVDVEDLQIRILGMHRADRDAGQWQRSRTDESEFFWWGRGMWKDRPDCVELHPGEGDVVGVVGE